MREFNSVSAFVEFLKTREAAIERAQREGLEAAGEMLEHSARELIGQEYPEWPPLSPRTIAEKQRLGFYGQVSSSDPLLRTGALRDSIKHSVEDDEVILGSDDPFAEFHEFGTELEPPRPFIGTTMFREGHDAAKLVWRHVMGAFVGRRVS